MAFLVAWVRLAEIITGSIALLSFVFGDRMQALLPLGADDSFLGASVAVVVLTVVNILGIASGARVQTWLTLLEAGGLLLIVVAGLRLLFGGDAAPAGGAATAAAGPLPAAFGMAMVSMLLTFGGWKNASYISAELKARRRNMLRALLISISLITGLYLLVTWTYWQGLGFAGMAASDAIAADVLRAAFGESGARLIAAVVGVAALTSINATMIVGARTSFALGRDWPQLTRLGRWDGERGTPSTVLLLQGAACMLLIGL